MMMAPWRYSPGLDPVIESDSSIHRPSEPSEALVDEELEDRLKKDNDIRLGLLANTSKFGATSKL